MRLIVWIVDPDTATLRQLQDAWHAVAGTRVVLQLYTALPPVGRRIPIFSWQKYNLAVRQ